MEEKELLERLGWWKKAYIEKYRSQIPNTERWDKFNEQAYQEIRELIKNKKGGAKCQT